MVGINFLLFCFVAGALGSHLKLCSNQGCELPLCLFREGLQFQVLGLESLTQFQFLFVFEVSIS